MVNERFYAKVKLDNIGRNIDFVRNTISEETMIMAVIKANAYGHGAVEVAHYLSKKADWFGVATLDEALELRDNSISEPILILGAIMPYEFETAVKNGITVTICDTERAEELNSIAGQLGEIADVHIKVDTGMSRIGFSADSKSVAEVKRISQMPNLNLSGIFSHFAKADELNKSSAEHQVEIFEWFVSELDREGVIIPIKHLSNSAAIMEMDCRYNMVRMGIMLYGLCPSDEMNKDYELYPAMELISHISFLKNLPENCGISYGHTFITDKPMKVATVPVGYADGYPRSLSNKAEVLIHGKRCKILGRICMDQMMVDVSDIEEVSLGDEVILVGSSGGDTITVDEVAFLAGSFNYEFVCGIGARVPRVFFKDGEQIKEFSYLVNNKN